MVFCSWKRDAAEWLVVVVAMEMHRRHRLPITMGMAMHLFLLLLVVVAAVPVCNGSARRSAASVRGGAPGTLAALALVDRELSTWPCSAKDQTIGTFSERREGGHVQRIIALTRMVRVVSAGSHRSLESSH